MKKTISVLIAVMLCVAITASFAGCTTTTGVEEESDVFVAATIDTADGLPSSEAEIIAFYNNIVSSVQDNANFTAENKPGVKTNESLSVDNINITSDNEAVSLDALNKSTKAIKDRVLSGIDTSVPVIAFGDMNNSADSVIYPYDSPVVNLTSEDVVSAECSADGSNVKIKIVLAGEEATVKNVFGIRDKAAVLENINKNCENYMTVSDYTVDYVFVDTDEEKTYSTIDLSVELEKQSDGSYKCTGRITSFRIRIVADVVANASCKGSFSELGNISLNFRLTDEKSYEFDWLGNSTWEPVSE